MTAFTGTAVGAVAFFRGGWARVLANAAAIP
jgi:hypothetical protein